MLNRRELLKAGVGVAAAAGTALLLPAEEETLEASTYTYTIKWDPNQYAFDTMVAHMRKQGEKCIVPENNRADGGMCRYRHECKACAVGSLIEDNEYDEKLYEGAGIYEDLDQDAFERCNYSVPVKFYEDLFVDPPPLSNVGELMVLKGYNPDLCQAMQFVHDQSDPELWEKGFIKVAATFDLIYDPPEKCSERRPGVV